MHWGEYQAVSAMAEIFVKWGNFVHRRVEMTENLGFFGQEQFGKKQIVNFVTLRILDKRPRVPFWAISFAGAVHCTLPLRLGSRGSSVPFS